MQSLGTGTLETEAQPSRRSEVLKLLAERFRDASHERGVWVGAKESWYIAQVLDGYSELVDKLNGVWKENGKQKE